jgi:small conductance mechanosensitive channel
MLIVFATAAAAQTESESKGTSLLEQLDNLDRGILQLQALNGTIETASARGREALIYRLDQRSFSLLADLDKLAREAAQLPAEDPLRGQVEERLRQELSAVGTGVFTRIDNVGERIDAHIDELASLSGGRLIAPRAYINSLELVRFQYYEALVDIFEARQLLGLPSDDLKQALQHQLYLHAETLAGLAEFAGKALQEVQGRLEQDSANAELQAAVHTMTSKQRLLLRRLQTMVALLERLDLDSSSYKGILIQQSDSLSLRVLETEVVMDLLRDGLVSLRESLVAQAPDLLVRLLVFLLILLAFRTLSRLTKRAVGAACARPNVDMSALLKNVLVSISGGTVMVIGILMALSQIGISLGPMLAGLGVAGFVVGFALQDTLGNFAAGSMILIYRPYDVDDFVEVAGVAGLVKKMSLVSTTITTYDNQTLVVPNSKIWGDVIKNVTAQKVRRVDLEFGIGYGDDVEHAERVFEDILKNHDKVLDNPEAMVKLSSLGDSSINFVVRPWVKTEDYWDVYFDLMREVKLRLDREGISIPFPQRDVHLYNEQA